MVKKFSTVLMMVIMILGAAACSNNESSTIVQAEPDTAMQEPGIVMESAVFDADEKPKEDEAEQQEMEGDNMKIRVATDDLEVIFVLNDTSAAKSLYEQLPLTIDVENYSNNEKIFYPDKLDCTNVIEDACRLGTLAYFSPWGDVVMFYGSQSKYPGLYILGDALEGADNISSLTGKIEITKIEE